jgi:hypothetical protein
LLYFPTYRVLTDWNPFAIKNYPDKQQLLIYDSFYPSNNNKSTADIFAKMMSSSSTANPENYSPMPFHHKEILNIAEELYDRLLKIAVNNTIYPLSHSARGYLETK